MKKIKLTLSVIVILICGITNLTAQEAVMTSGGEASGTGGTVSYSVGQLVYTTNSGTNGSIAQGVQQPFEISIVAEIEETEGIELICNVFPNPASKYLTLKINQYESRSLKFQLFDMDGKLLESRNITNNEIDIDMRYLVPANYLLRVTCNESDIKTFKIIKN